MVAKGRSDLVRTKPVAEKKIKPTKKTQQGLGCSDKAKDSLSDKSNADVQSFSELHTSTTPEIIINNAQSIEINKSNCQSTSEKTESNHTESSPVNEEVTQSKTIISTIKRLFKFQLHICIFFIVNDVLIELMHLTTVLFSGLLFLVQCFMKSNLKIDVSVLQYVLTK